MLNRLALSACVASASVFVWSVATAAEGTDRSVELVDCSTPARVVSIPAAASVAIRSTANTPLFLRIAERGDLLELSGPGEIVVSHVLVPYRYGMHRVELAPGQGVQLQRATASKRNTTALLSVDCASDAVALSQREWMSGIAATTTLLNGYITKQQSASLLDTIKRLSASAATPLAVALATHVRAQILLLSTRNADAALAFADAAKAWRAAGDEARARVALVGEVEDLQRLARHADALALVDKESASWPEHDYFAARLRLSRCLTLRYLGRMSEALHCFETGIGAMERLDETPDVVSALQDMADVSRFLGDLPGARKLGLRALQQSTLPQMETQRGRIHRMLGNIALAQGDVATAIREFDLALTEFVASGSPRWQASALLQTARLYADLGALEEASAFVSAALEKLSERDAPARFAAARVVQADIDSRRDRLDAVREGLSKAVETYTRLDMPADLDSARLAQGRLALRNDDPATAAERVAARDQNQRLNAIDWLLLAARVAAVQGNCSSAAKALRLLDGKVRSIDAELERVIASADCLVVAGKTDAAQSQLWATAQRIAALAGQVDSPLLRQMLVNKIAPLRRNAFRLAGDSSAGQWDAEWVWRWLRIDDAAPPTSTNPGIDATDATRFDAAVASELLAPQSDPSNAAAPRQLLALLANRPNGSKAPAAIVPQSTLAQFQQRLGNAVYVSFVDAGEHAQLLWVRRDSVHLQATLDASRLRAGSEALLTATGQLSTPVQVIDAQARHLSNALLSADAGDAAPAQLLVDAASPLAGLPWSVLVWPNARLALLETTRVSLVRNGVADRAVAKSATDVAVFVAGQDNANANALQPLWNAEAEPALISAGIAARNGHVQRIAGNDRAALLDAFARPHGWLHVAAHGDARVSRIGYAGIWLDADAKSRTPAFVSWLDILGRGSRSDLVVLNACDLAEDTGSRSAALSFADAVSRAGARDVVAARWQVSDAATALWVPLFYRQLGVGASPAQALWQVRRQLHDSRRFRHPFYWAAWVHFGHI